MASRAKNDDAMITCGPLPDGPGQGEGSVAAGAEAEHIDRWNTQVPQHGCDVVRRTLGREGPINGRGASVALLLDGEDLPSPDQQRDELVEVGLDRGSAAVDEQQGHTVRQGFAVNLVIHPKQAVVCITVLKSHTPT